MDLIDYKVFFAYFYLCIDKINKDNKLSDYLINNYLVIAYDATLIHSSKKLKSNKCTIKKHRDGSTTYHAYMLAGAIISEPKKKLSPLLLPHEFIQTQDGAAKQDCELNLAYRWLENNAKNFLKYHDKIVLVGDSLYSCEPMCRKILNENLNFVTRCKEGNNKTIYEFIKGIEGIILTEKVHIKHNIYEIRTYKYYEDVPIKNEKNYSKKLNTSNTLKVNFVEVTIETKIRNSKNQYEIAKYKEGNDVKDMTFSYITNLKATQGDIKTIINFINIGKSSWEIENKVFNTLKNLGYNLSHVYGYGKTGNAFYVYVVLNLLAYSVHTTAELLDTKFREIFKSFQKTKGEYFQIFSSFCLRDQIKKLEGHFHLSGMGGNTKTWWRVSLFFVPPINLHDY
jgi:hypothetical protein